MIKAIVRSSLTTVFFKGDIHGYGGNRYFLSVGGVESDEETERRENLNSLNSLQVRPQTVRKYDARPASVTYLYDKLSIWTYPDPDPYQTIPPPPPAQRHYRGRLCERMWMTTF